MLIPAGHPRWQGVVHSSVVYSRIILRVIDDRLIMCLGQTRSQVPQPVHLFSFTTGKPWGPMEIASNGQALAQVPSPRHPMVQTFMPPPRSATARQSSNPLYTYLVSAFWTPKKQPGKAMSGSTASILTPMMPAMASATSGPAATHEFGAERPATMASALALQPGSPHPPQLAPGNSSSISRILGSTYT